MRPLSIVIGGVFVLGAFAACSDDDGTATTTEAAVVTEAPATTDSVDWSATCGEYEGRDADDTAQVEAICATAAAFMEAINTYDSEALLAVTTEDFTYQTTGDPFTRDEFIPYFGANYEAGNFTVTPTGPTVIVGVAGFVTYEIVEPGEVTSEDYNATGTSTYIVTGLDADDAWLVESFVWTED